MAVDIVIARYKEDLSWIYDLAPHLPEDSQIFIYDKGKDYIPPEKNYNVTTFVRTLENVGNEAHTWLMHLADMCKSPSFYNEATLFLQGNPFDHCSLYHIQKAIEAVEDPMIDFQWITNRMSWDDRFAAQNHMGLRLEATYSAVFGYPAPDEGFTFGVGGQFMVRDDHVFTRKQSFYLRAAKVVAYTYGREHAPWCAFERFWDRLFTDKVL